MAHYCVVLTMMSNAVVAVIATVNVL